MAADSTVVPQTDASTSWTESSGRQRDAQTSRNVPWLAISLSAGLTQSSSSSRSRWNSCDRLRSTGRRRSRSQCRTSGSRRTRRVRQVFTRSASSGTVGTRSLTEPRAWPTTRWSVTKRTACSSPSQSTARVASVTSVSPASGRERRLASVSASRTASMTCALEVGRSRSRSARATLISQRGMVRSGAVHRWWYQPGEVIPAPYPAPLANRSWVQGTQVSVTFRLALPRSAAASRLAGGSGQARTGACQAPQTTAIRDRPRRRAARMVCRMYASRRCSSGLGGLASRRSSAIASVISGNGEEESSRDSTRSSHHRSGSSYPAAAASVPSGSRPGSGDVAPCLRFVGKERARPRPRRQHHGGGQVAEPDLDGVPAGPDHRLPLRRVHRVRPEGGDLRLVPRIGQQRQRRLHALRRHPADQRIGIGRTLDQHRVGLVLLQRGQQRPRRAGTVVPDAEDPDGVVLVRRRRWRDGLDHRGGHDTSRQAA